MIMARLNALTASNEGNGGNEATASNEASNEAQRHGGINEEPETPQRRESLRQSRRRQFRRRSSTDALFLEDLPPPQVTGLPLIQIYSVNIS